MTDLVVNLARVAVGQSAQLPTEYRLIIFDLRLPRIVLGMLVGGALSVSGAGFQALLRNPLADPYVLGVSSGAALGAIIALIAAPQIPLVTPVVVPARAAALRFPLSVTLVDATGGKSVPDGIAMFPVGPFVLTTPLAPADQPCPRKPLASTRYPDAKIRQFFP